MLNIHRQNLEKNAILPIYTIVLCENMFSDMDRSTFMSIFVTIKVSIKMLMRILLVGQRFGKYAAKG